MKKVLFCGQLFPATGEEVLRDQAVLIDGETIEAVMPRAQFGGEDYQVIDLSDKFVTPGLIDAHVHTNIDGELNFMEQMISETVGACTIRSLCNARSDLMAGFTSLRDMGSYGFADIALRDGINAGKVVGPRMLCSGLCIGSTGGHADSWFNPYITGMHEYGYVIDGPDEARKAARLMFKYGADQLKIMATGGVGSPGEPGAPELSFEEMKAMLDIANSRGKLSSAHAHGAQGIKNAIRAGVATIEHGMLMDDECIDLMAAHGTYLVPTIIAGDRIVEYGTDAGIPASAVEKSARCLENHQRNLAKCREKGVKIGFGTDAGTFFNHHGEQTYELVLMVRYGFTPAQALLAATKVNAELMRWSHRVGTVEAGKFADFAAFDQNLLEHIEAVSDCSFVMKGGQVCKGQAPAE